MATDYVRNQVLDNILDIDFTLSDFDKCKSVAKLKFA